MQVVMDFETESLNPKKIHCAHAYNIETKEEYHFVSRENLESLRLSASSKPSWVSVKLQTLEDLPEFLTSCDKIIGHNFIDFDLYKVINGILNIKIPLNKIVDTYVISRLTDCDRGLKDSILYSKKGKKAPKALVQKPHSLEAYGIRCGYNKPEIENWDFWDFDKSDRCRDDVIINYRAYRDILLPELKGFSVYSLKLEQKVAQVITEMRTNGFALDKDYCEKLFQEVSQKEQEYEEALISAIEPLRIYKKTHMNWVPKKKKDGSYGSVVLRLLSEYEQEVNPDGSLNLYKLEPYNPRSPKQTLEVLERAGWKPVVFKKPSKTQKEKGWVRGNPEITNEDNLETIPEDAPQEIHLIPLFLRAKHKRELTEEWLKLYNESEDGRVRGYVNSLGTPTARMRHEHPNMANISKVLYNKDGEVLRGESGKYGFEMRSCWSVSDKTRNRLVGADASGLELRILCHYMNDPLYTKTLLSGDIHTMNQEAAGLPSRDMAKTFIYALLYGAGDAKIGKIVGGTAEDGARLKAKFFKNIPALGRLVEAVQEKAGREKRLIGLDGRILNVRHQHAALNTLLQSGGAIVMKQALIMADKWLKDSGKWFLHVNNVHDEFQLETLKEHADFVGETCVKAIIAAGEWFNMNIPLDGEYKVGLSWANTH